MPGPLLRMLGPSDGIVDPGLETPLNGELGAGALVIPPPGVVGDFTRVADGVGDAAVTFPGGTSFPIP